MTYNDLDYSGVYALNSYVWKLLEANLGWRASDYQNGIPILPTDQQPELMQQSKSFLVYGAATQPAQFLYALRTDSISYTVYAVTATEANAVLSLLIDAFERQDEAAADVNNHTDADPRNRKVSFGSVGMKMAQHALSTDDEGGYVKAYILLEAKYTATNDTAVFSGFTYP
jgi:methylmalonyl-CoA mutase N-terminal domain/subunit